MKTKQQSPVTLTFTVQVTVGRQDAQTMQEFLNEDLEAIKPYLKNKLERAVSGAWKSNAVVVSEKVFLK